MNSSARPILFLSDLHLPTDPSPYRAAFCRFLDGPAQGAAAIYILGDLFDAWIGDDVGLDDYADECSKLAELARHSVPVYFQRGNRDFLVGRAFADCTGVQLLPEYACVDLPIGVTLIAHGDGLCLDDITFQRFRYWTHNSFVQSCFLHLPQRARRRISLALQRANNRTKINKSAQDTDVNDRAVLQLLRRYGANRLIHGHTHRPGRYVLNDGGFQLERIVLPDWRPTQMSYLSCDSHGLHTELVP